MPARPAGKRKRGKARRGGKSRRRRTPRQAGVDRKNQKEAGAGRRWCACVRATACPALFRSIDQSPLLRAFTPPHTHTDDRLSSELPRSWSHDGPFRSAPRLGITTAPGGLGTAAGPVLPLPYPSGRPSQTPRPVCDVPAAVCSHVCRWLDPAACMRAPLSL